MPAALVPDIVVELGAVAGLAAFLGIALLTIVLVVQGRDVKRLREWAGRAPERDAEFQAATAAMAAERAAELRTATDELPHGDPLEAEARAMQLRAARQRNRQSSGSSRLLQGLLAVLAVAVVAGGTYFVVGQISDDGGDETAEQSQAGGKKRNQGGDGGGNGRRQPANPSEIQVAVLNGTSATGLASTFQAEVSAAGYEIGPVGNSQSTFSQSSVMFVPGFRPEAEAFAETFGIAKVERMIEEVVAVAEGAPIAVVLGDDKVPSA